MRRVLIVDDLLDCALTLKDNFALKGHNAKYHVFSPGVVEFALEFRPEWVVLDYRMPFKSGLEVFKELNEQADFKFSAVFYSSYVDDPLVIAKVEELKIPEKAIVPKSTDLDSDVSEKLIPALEAGYLRGGGKNAK